MIQDRRQLRRRVISTAVTVRGYTGFDAWKMPGIKTNPGMPPDSVCPASDGGVVLARDSSLLGQDHVRKYGDVGDRGMGARDHPIQAFLFAEPEVLIERAEQLVSTCSHRRRYRSRIPG